MLLVIKLRGYFNFTLDTEFVQFEQAKLMAKSSSKVAASLKAFMSMGEFFISAKVEAALILREVSRKLFQQQMWSYTIFSPQKVLQSMFRWIIWKNCDSNWNFYLTPNW